MPQDAMDRLKSIADGLQKNQVAQLEAVVPVITASAPSGAAADPSYFHVYNGRALHSLSEELAETHEDRQGREWDVDEVRNLVQGRLVAAAQMEADAQPSPTAAAPASTGSATSAGVSVVPNIAVDLSAPNTLDATSRSWMAKAMAALAVVALGIAVTGLIIGDGDTDPGSMPVLCVVVAMIASIGAVLITLGYGSVRLGTGTNSPSATGSPPTPPPGSTTTS